MLQFYMEDHCSDNVPKLICHSEFFAINKIDKVFFTWKMLLVYLNWQFCFSKLLLWDFDNDFCILKNDYWIVMHHNQIKNHVYL